MPVAQTELTDAEYQLITEYMRKHGLTMKEALRQAILRLALADTVDPKDPVFTTPPLVKATGKGERTSVDHDRLLYERSA